MSRERPAPLKQFEISAQALLSIGRKGRTYEVVEGIPTDAELVDAGYDYRRQMFYMTLRHDDFDNVLEGERIPTADVDLRTIGHNDEPDPSNNEVQA